MSDLRFSDWLDDLTEAELQALSAAEPDDATNSVSPLIFCTWCRNDDDFCRCVPFLGDCK
jgi:hypothetical protein